MFKKSLVFIVLLFLISCKQNPNTIEESKIVVQENIGLIGVYKPISIFKTEKAIEDSINTFNVTPELIFLNDSIVEISPDFTTPFFKERVFKYKISTDLLFLKGESKDFKIKFKFEDNYKDFRYLTLYYDNLYLKKIIYIQSK